MRRTRPVLAALAAAALLATAACTAEEAPIGPPAPPAAEGSAAAPAPVDTSCNPRASLRPSGALPAPGRMPAGSQMAKIRENGRLVLGTSQDTLLFSSRNPFTGKVEGFDVDMGKQIAKAIFGDPEKLQIKVVPRPERTNWVRDGKVDLVISTMTTNCARRKEVDFSTVYFETGQRVLVAKDSIVESIDDLDRQKVCAASGSTSLENIEKQPGEPVAVGKASFGECLVAFQQNEVAAISTDDTILAGLAAQDPYAKVVGDRFTEEPYAIAISKEHPELTRFVNQVLERSRADGTWAATYKRWLGATGAVPPPPPAAQYR
ncbi:glutamate ABC transporter substrate-binding protein [Actinoplanes sp. GCM10030250]|uniref:glutamate ABC transporter substrate-binding protein n=1 Tax=Actinoplanes sp. GCM10030250 TaxID=3273376 RepID=UPI00361B2D2A